MHKTIQWMAVAAAVSVGAAGAFASSAWAATPPAAAAPQAAAPQAAAPGVAGTALGPNGEAAKPGSVILADAKRATEAAQTVHVVTTGTSDRLNIVAGHGQGSGTVSQGSSTFHIVIRRGEAYVRANETTWLAVSKDKPTSKLLANRWIKFSASGTGKGYAQAVRLSTVLDAATTGSVKKMGTTTFDGQPAIHLVDKSGADIYVAADGPAYLLAVQGGGTLSFTHYNTARVAAVPRGAVSLQTLEGN